MFFAFNSFVNKSQWKEKSFGMLLGYFYRSNLGKLPGVWSEKVQSNFDIFGCKTTNTKLWHPFLGKILEISRKSTEVCGMSGMNFASFCRKFNKETSVFFQLSLRSKGKKLYTWIVWKQKRKFWCENSFQKWMIEQLIRFSKGVWRIYLQSAPRSSEFSLVQLSQVNFNLFQNLSLANCSIFFIIFTDTLMERNNLMSKCYPRIKDYCREKHGLEFQVRKEACLSINQ